MKPFILWFLDSGPFVCKSLILHASFVRALLDVRSVGTMIGRWNQYGRKKSPTIDTRHARGKQVKAWSCFANGFLDVRNSVPVVWADPIFLYVSLRSTLEYDLKKQTSTKRISYLIHSYAYEWVDFSVKNKRRILSLKPWLFEPAKRPDDIEPTILPGRLPG